MLKRTVINWFNGTGLPRRRFTMPEFTWPRYNAIAILTYGFSFNMTPIVDDRGDITAFTSLVFSCAWPLYWSAEVFSWFIP